MAETGRSSIPSCPACIPASPPPPQHLLGTWGELTALKVFTDYFHFVLLHLVFSSPLFSSQNPLAAHKRNRLNSSIA